MNLNLDQPPRGKLGSLKIPPGKYIWSPMGSPRPELKVTVDESESFNHFVLPAHLGQSQMFLEMGMSAGYSDQERKFR